jgi:adenylate cyclase
VAKSLRGEGSPNLPDMAGAQKVGVAMEKLLLVGDWRVSPVEGVLVRGAETVRLEPKAMEVLVYLASRPREVVSREDLERAVWHGALVGYDAVTSTVIKLRKALGDSARQPTYIATIPKRGYQLIAPIQLLDEASNFLPLPETAELRLSRHLLGPSTARQIVIGIVVLVIVALSAWSLISLFPSQNDSSPPKEPVRVDAARSVVVLPFENLSGDDDQDYFSDGMTEDLITDLSKTPTLTVISRTSAFAYKDSEADIPAIAKELAVSHVIVGSVRRVGQRVRINVKLVDAGSGKHLWAERYDRELNSIFALQDEVREKIVSALAVELAFAETERHGLKRTASFAAYDLLMKGRHQEASFTREGNEQAIRFYEQAIEIDPFYAEAYARMANMHDLRSRLGWSLNSSQDLSKALTLAQKALALDDSNPYSHWTLGRIVSRIRSEGVESLERAVVSLERAIELDPNYADAYAYLSHLYVGIGKPKEALAAIQTALKLNPQYPFWYIRNRGLLHYVEGNSDEAIADLEEATTQNSTAMMSRWWLAAAYVQAGLREEAEWQIEELRALGFHSSVQELIDNSVIHHPPYLKRLESDLRTAGLTD